MWYFHHLHFGRSFWVRGSIKTWSICLHFFKLLSNAWPSQRSPYSAGGMTAIFDRQTATIDPATSIFSNATPDRSERNIVNPDLGWSWLQHHTIALPEISSITRFRLQDCRYHPLISTLLGDVMTAPSKQFPSLTTCFFILSEAADIAVSSRVHWYWKQEQKPQHRSVEL